MNDLQQMVNDSIVIYKQTRLIAVQQYEIALLRARLRAVDAKVACLTRYDLNDPVPALLRRQAG